MIEVKREATVIQFRARTDINQKMARNDIKWRITTFKGVFLGTTGDGYDVVATFNTEGDAWRWLMKYYDSEPPECGIGSYVLIDTVQL